MFHYNNVIEEYKIESDFGNWRQMLNEAYKYFDELKGLYDNNCSYYKKSYYLIDVYGVRTE